MILWSWYYKKLIKKIDHYILRNYLRIFIRVQYLWSWQDFYDHWTIYWMTLASPVLLCICQTSLALLCIYHLILPPLHCPVIEIHIIFTIYHWYSWYRFWVMYTELHTILHLHWLIKLNKLGLLRETVAGKIQGGVLGRGPLVGLDATHDLVLYARSFYYMLHDIWVQWIVSPYYQDPLTHHLFDMQLSYGMGHRMVALVRVKTC